MSTATTVPETWELTGDDARRTLATVSRKDLLRDSFARLRVADGFSHARSLAFMTSLVLVQGVIVLVGFAEAVGSQSISEAIVKAVKGVAPGPAGALLTDAVAQARSAGASRRYLPLVVGLVGGMVSGTTLMGQLERGLNRIYGVEQDRPTVEKYRHALGLAVGAGTAISGAFVIVILGHSLGDSIRNDTLSRIWDVVHWPLALALIASATALLFRWAPRRHQPGWSWLAYGASVAVLLWIAVTLLLGVTFRLSTTFGETYGALAGIVALQLWALLSSSVLLFGGSVGAQLESVRAGRPAPQDEQRAAETEPASDAEFARSQHEQLGHEGVELPHREQLLHDVDTEVGA